MAVHLTSMLNDRAGGSLVLVGKIVLIIFHNLLGVFFKFISVIHRSFDISFKPAGRFTFDTLVDYGACRLIVSNKICLRLFQAISGSGILYTMS